MEETVCTREGCFNDPGKWQVQVAPFRKPSGRQAEMDGCFVELEFTVSVGFLVSWLGFFKLCSLSLSDECVAFDFPPRSQSEIAIGSLHAWLQFLFSHMTGNM